MRLNPQTKFSSNGRNALIATADVVGLINGSSDGSSIGFWVGWAFGNPAVGKVIGGIVGGLLVGAAYSVITSTSMSVTADMNAEQMYNNTIDALILSGQLECIKIDTCANISFKLMQTQDTLPIKFSRENIEAEFIGQAHNAAVNVMIDHNRVTKASVEKFNNIDRRVLDALYSDELKEVFINNYNLLINSPTDTPIESLIQLEEISKEKIILDKYFELHKSYVVNTEESIEITNRYIQIVESSNELTKEEKQVVNSALVLSSYSTDLWTNLQ